MNSDLIRVSIGMPVYNGENFVGEAIESILGQTFSGFELIISDNASDDQTEEICLNYAKQDPRIRYYRNEVNLGAAPNYNRLVGLSRGEYFKWASHDDVCAPEFLAQCVKVLDRDPSIILCYTKTSVIDQNGEPFLNYLVEQDIQSENRYERFRNTIIPEHWCFQVFGVMRTNVLRKTQLIGPYSDSDRVLLAELSLRGRVYEVPEYLFLRREHLNTSTNVYRTDKERMVWFDPSNSGRLFFPTWLKFFGYLKSINRVPMSRSERVLCYAQLGRWIVVKTSTRLGRKLMGRVDRGHLAVPVKGVDWR